MRLSNILKDGITSAWLVMMMDGTAIQDGNLIQLSKVSKEKPPIKRIPQLLYYQKHLGGKIMF